MASYTTRALLTLRGTTMINTNTTTKLSTCFRSPNKARAKRNFSIQSSSSSSSSSLDPPDVARLAETARISLTPQEVEDFGPKIQQVVDWFGQLQGVDLKSIEPAIRSDIDGDNLRDDVPQTFENREAIIGAIPSFEDPYIKVPKVLKSE